MPVTKSSDSKFIITDDPFFEGKIADYSKKIKAKVLTLNELDQIESDSNGRIAKVLFYISRYELESKHHEIHQFLKNHPTIMSNFIVRAPIDYTGYIALNIEEDLFLPMFLMMLPLSF